MSSDASAPARGDVADVDDYDEMLDILDCLIEEGVRKVESGRVRDAEKERVRIKWIRVTANVIDIRRKVQADRDLEELQSEVEALKADRGGSE